MSLVHCNAYLTVLENLRGCVSDQLLGQTLLVRGAVFQLC